MVAKKENTKKYEIVKDLTIPYNGNTLYRIRALKDFDDVKKGDVGGWVESEKNLSQKGKCWIYNNAKACGKARVTDNACLLDRAVVDSKARVCGDSRVCDDALITDFAVVRGSALVRDYACISGFGLVEDHSFVYGKATISDRAKVSDYSRVGDSSKVTGGSVVGGRSFIIGNAYIGGDVCITGHELIDFDVVDSSNYVTYKDPFADDIYYTACTYRDIWLTAAGRITAEEFLNGLAHEYKDFTSDRLPISRIDYIRSIVENHKKLFKLD